LKTATLFDSGGKEATAKAYYYAVNTTSFIPLLDDIVFVHRARSFV